MSGNRFTRLISPVLASVVAVVTKVPVAYGVVES